MFTKQKSTGIKKLILFTIVPLLVSGCVIQVNSNGSGTGSAGGVFVSTDKGNTWTTKDLIPTTQGTPGSISGLDANDLVLDPSDSDALYYGSVDNGLYYTYDKGNDWQAVISLGKINVKAVAVDPNAKCTIYVASQNRVLKSTDCSRTWNQVYYDNDPTVTVTALAVDYYNDANVYMGLSRGDVLKSTDRGNSWRALNRFEDVVEKILISPADSRIVFVGIKGRGISRSKDGGSTWTDLSDALKQFKDTINFRDLAASQSDPNTIILANSYGLVRSTDNGDTWTGIQLLTPENAATINAVAVSPKNSDEIYYVTNTTFYRSSDGGKTWTTKKLPTQRAGWKLIVDPDNAGMIYMAVKAVK